MRTLLAMVSDVPSAFDVNLGPEPGASAEDSERYSSRYAKLYLRRELGRGDDARRDEA